LTELLVFGSRAGKSAAQFAATQESGGTSVASLAADEMDRLNRQYLRKSGGTERIADIRKAMHTCMESGAGIYRTQASLEKSQEVVRTLKERFKNIAIADTSRVFNTELIAAIELSYLLDIAETIIQAALLRKESRGSHQRTDFPQRDDKNFLAHSLVFKKEQAPPEVKYHPVTITRWPPGERIYGR
jgi:fumarate reductase flavoprotein subunit